MVQSLWRAKGLAEGRAHFKIDDGSSSQWFQKDIIDLSSIHFLVATLTIPVYSYMKMIKKHQENIYSHIPFIH